MGAAPLKGPGACTENRDSGLVPLGAGVLVFLLLLFIYLFIYLKSFDVNWYISTNSFFFYKFYTLFIYLFIYLFIFGCVGSSFLCGGFL